METKKRQYKEAVSSLRLVLNYPGYTKATGQFKRISFRGADYIYNSKSQNIIATIRRGSKGWLVRYRPASYYAPILAAHAEYLHHTTPYTAAALASFNLSRQERRIRRFAQNYSPQSRQQVMERMRNNFNVSRMWDGLTMDRREQRQRSRDIRRLHNLLDGTITYRTDWRYAEITTTTAQIAGIDPNYQEYQVLQQNINNMNLSDSLNSARAMLGGVNEVNHSEQETTIRLTPYPGGEFDGDGDDTE